MTVRACEHCGAELVGGRVDRRFCDRACRSKAARRRAGKVARPAAVTLCADCGRSLAEFEGRSRRCPACRSWRRRHPDGGPNPALIGERICARVVCGKPIIGRNAKARFCCRDCDVEHHNETRDAAGIAEWARERYRQRPDVRAYYGRYRRRNAARRQEWARADRAADPDRYRQYRRAWIDQNPDRYRRIYREAQARRRARIRSNPGSVGVSERDWLRLVRRYRGRCAYCGERPVEHLDHVIPISRGGRHAIGNVLPACGPCNLSKHARLLVEWRAGVRVRRAPPLASGPALLLASTRGRVGAC